MALFLGVMATDSPSSTMLDMVLGAVFGFLVVLIPMVGLPLLSKRELQNYKTNKKLLFNIINSVLIFFTMFMPLALFNFYIFYKLHEDKSN